MFRHRKNSQKPANGLYVAFRESFPDIRSSCTAVASEEISLGDGLIDTTLEQSRIASQSSKIIGDIGVAPRASHEYGKFTPPLPYSYPSLSTSNQHLVYSTSTAEGTGTPYYNEDIGLAPTEIEVGIGIRSPLLSPTLGDGVHVLQMADTSPCSLQTARTYDLCHFNLSDHPWDSAPCHLRDYPSDPLSGHVSDGPPDFKSPDHLPGTPTISGGHLEAKLDGGSPVVNLPYLTPDTSLLAPLQASTEKCRFRTTLNASTAMVQQADEVPITYLNKGQVYTVYIVDTAPITPGLSSVQYRTSICVSIGDRKQGLGPEKRWDLWKAGRGADEAHRHDGKIQGVEYVEAGDIADSKTRVKQESTSLNGFSVLWTRGSDELADCHVAMRFNFLSTDFNYSKGVKGILSRLCAKTEVISPNSLYYSPEPPEICICNVKVFRDHGAERKHSNDMAYVKKSIDKLKQQIVQAQAGISNCKKRKRAGLDAVEIDWSGKMKDPRHTKALPKSSARPTVDLNARLQAMQGMFASAQLVSVFCIQGQEQDDSDLHPLTPVDDLQHSNSLHLRSPLDQSVEGQIPQQVSPDKSTKRARHLQSDPTSKPLLEGSRKPVTCFYICNHEPHPLAAKEYYQSVYIIKRETEGLMSAIAAKCNFDPTSILKVVKIIQNGPAIEADDYIAHDLPTCCEMVLDLSGIMALPLKREQDNVANDTPNSEEARAVLEAIESEGYFLKLIF